ncbi:MAG: prolyl oligopeptidase family serine peptidase [Verrucomicrobia bacterium]|nr:prolyl oligopeptidase family serine peptidase [Verrucomicrobiota bacterium]
MCIERVTPNRSVGTAPIAPNTDTPLFVRTLFVLFAAFAATIPCGAGGTEWPPIEPAAADEFSESAPADWEHQDSPQQRGGRFGQASGRVFKDRITPHWFANNTRFWYRNDLREGAKEFVLVDAVKGIRMAAFDHEKLADSLSKAAGVDYKADRLPFDDLDFGTDSKSVRFKVGGLEWQCDLTSYKCSKVETDPAPARKANEEKRQAGDSDKSVPLRALKEPFSLTPALSRWERENQFPRVANSERFGSFAKPPPRLPLPTGEGWGEGERRDLYREPKVPFHETPILPPAEDESPQAQQDSVQERGPRARGTGDSIRASTRSRDGKWTALVKDHNVFIRPAEAEAQEIQLSHDGKEGLAYGRLSWAPDSKTLVAFRIEPGDRKEVYLIQSSPPEGGRAKMQSRPYALPGDKFSTSELNLFDPAARKQIKPDVERFEHGWLAPRLHWNRENSRLSYEQADRGHQRFRVIDVDVRTGQARNLIDEKSETFIWTAHTENVRLNRVNWLENTEEIIYASEQDGWRHLYLIDAKEGRLKNQITKGEFVVRGIDRIDEEQRQVWFNASGRNPDQDPYLIHYYRVNFDGTELIPLTEGNGNHSLQYSPDRKYLIDTYSRVDLAPIHELRQASDGKLFCRLEEADITDLKSSGWEAPEVLVAKGRDGKTDIWGIISRPRNLDPKQKYPVLEDIYAGPQSSFVPKSFSAGSRYESLTKLGFIVVKIDGMGTANRAKAFHDVCWHNLKDAGFEDRILWMKAAAAKYPYMDLTRVGIYGTSAGGQNAAGAVLFHPEFYKVAVAACGCHDNRMDKASWNEQWMGYPVGPQYSASSNIDNAHRLRGKLLLIVGQMDTNVPPESTMRFADALIKAGKDFDLVVVPGAGHGPGGAYGMRRRDDFFVRHLLGVEPPDRNAPSGTASSVITETTESVPR